MLTPPVQRVRAALGSVRIKVRRLPVQRRLRRFLEPQIDAMRISVASRTTPTQPAGSAHPGTPRSGSTRPSTSRGSDDVGVGPVFVYWAQGFDSAPPLVQLCAQQLRALEGDRVVLLTDANLGEHVTLPDDVVRKTSSDKTIFSDVIRLALLAEHGGVWIDATCLVTASPSAAAADVLQSGFFAFSREDRLLASWFLASRPDDYVVRMWLEAHYRYWARFDRKLDYFLTHYLFEALYELDPHFAACWAQTPTVSAGPPHALLGVVGHRYDPVELRRLLSQCFVHKLTHKISQGVQRSEDTMLGHLLQYGVPADVHPAGHRSGPLSD